jgi:hypothetical protein
MALNGNFPIEVEQQIYDMREGGKNTYLPSIGKRNSRLDKQINTIGKIDSEFEKRDNLKIIVLREKLIDAFTLMLLSEYNPKFYWVDSKTDFDKIMYCSQNFEDFDQMNSYLHAASQNYWFAFGRPSVNQLKKSTLEFCGVKPVKVFAPDPLQTLRSFPALTEGIAFTVTVTVFVPVQPLKSVTVTV